MASYRYSMSDDSLLFVNEWVWSKVHSNGTVYFTFSRTRPNFKRSGKLKGRKSLSSLSSCLFEALKVCHLQDQSLTDRQTDRQMDRQTD